MKKITTVLFDLDGVLIDSWPFTKASYKHVLDQHGLPTDGLEHPHMRHWTLHQAYDHLGLNSDPKKLEKVKAEHLKFQK